MWETGHKPTMTGDGWESIHKVAGFGGWLMKFDWPHWGELKSCNMFNEHTRATHCKRWTMLNILGLIIDDNSMYSVTRILEYYIQRMKYWETKKQTDRSFMYGQWVPLTGSLSAFLAARCYFSFLILLNSKSSLKKEHIKHIPTVPVGKKHTIFIPILAGYHAILVLIFGSYPNGLWPDRLRSQRPHSPPGASGSRSTHSGRFHGGLHELEIPKNGWFINGKSSSKYRCFRA